MPTPPVAVGEDPQRQRNPGLYLPVIQSPTRIELEQRCHRRHLLSDNLLREAYKSPSAAFGNVIHAGANTWWEETYVLHHSPTAAYEKMLDVSLTDYPKWLGQGKDYHTEELARRILNRYAKDASVAGGSLHDDWQVLDMERRFSFSLPNSRLTFKLDRILCSLSRGELLLVDTKTSSRPDERWARGMRRSIQQRIYHKVAAEIYKMPVTEHYIEGIDKKGSVGAIHYEQIDLLWTPSYVEEAIGLAQHSAENDARSLNAAYVDLDIDDMLEDEEETRDQALLLYAATKAPFNEQDCYSYYVECPFRGVCDAAPEERVALLNDESNFKRGEPWMAEEEM